MVRRWGASPLYGLARPPDATFVRPLDLRLSAIHDEVLHQCQADLAGCQWRHFRSKTEADEEDFG